jgi:probable rRNA maturation factor
MKINITNSYDDVSYLSLIEEALGVASQTLSLENKTVSMVFVNNNTIHEMNKTYRNKDYATDVLTFVDGTDDYLGDIIISIDKAKEQAQRYNHSFQRELSFLSIHGVLHCLGYDHQTPKEEAEMMDLTNQILNEANIKRV